MKPKQLIGPVHAAGGTASCRFIAVLVEHPLHPGLLAWMNIWSADDEHVRLVDWGRCYARVVSDPELAEWLRKGWQNTYID